MNIFGDIVAERPHVRNVCLYRKRPLKDTSTLFKIVFAGRQKFRTCSLTPAVSLRLFTRRKRGNTFLSCQSKMLNLICAQFRSDESLRSYKPKRDHTVFFYHALHDKVENI